MIDHVTIRVADLSEAHAFYTLALKLLDGPEISEGDGFVEWNDFSLAQANPKRPLTRRLHIGFQARDRAQVDRWWQTMRDAGHPDLGQPGARPEYTPSYYGAFIADPAGNSIEAVHKQPPRTDGTTIDHLWLRVRNLDASTRFYTTVAPIVGHQVRTRPQRTTIFQENSAIFSLVPGEPTEHLHLAFSARDAHTVDSFHQAGTQAGYTSLGEPGERPQYHPGYYGAYLADPDHNNIEAVHHDRRNRINVPRQLDGSSAEAVYHGRLRKGNAIIDHLWIRVTDLAEARRFYETLAPLLGLGIRGMRPERFHVTGDDRSFALVQGSPPTENAHLAFPATDDATVDRFHDAMVAAGFRDNGAPGIRPEYAPGYYGAFVLDPAGNNVEAVHHHRRPT